MNIQHPTSNIQHPRAVGLRAALIVGLIVTTALICGCASLRALSSPPPVKAIVLDHAAELTIGLGTKLSLPAGEYKPVLEDKVGYYYQAPSKLAVRDLFG